MPVNRVCRSSVAQEVAERALARHLLARGLLETASDGNGLLFMIPIYSISARNIVAGRWNRGWRSGWRYFWTHRPSEFGAVIEVRRAARAAPALASISLGSAALRLEEKLREKALELAADPQRYRPRILRLPWIGMEALWLNTDALDVPDKFVDRGGELLDDAFRTEAVSRAKKFLEDLK